MKHYLLSFLLLNAAAGAVSAQSAKPALAQDNWVITGKGPTQILTTARKAIFRDKVHLDALPEMELDCEILTATFGATGGRKFEQVEAERGVVIKIYELKDGKRTGRTATADRAVYQAAADTVTLVGNAKFEAEFGTLAAEKIHYNRATGDVTTEGDYVVSGKAGALDGGTKPAPQNKK